MRIAMFYHSLVSDWNHGNAHFLRGVASALLDAGHEIEIFEPRDAWSRQNLVAHAGAAAADAYRDAYPRLNSTRYDLRSFDFDTALQGVDLILAHEWNDHALIARLGEYRAVHPDCRLLFHDTHHRAATQPHAMAGYDLKHYDGVLAFGRVIRDLYLDRGWSRDAWTWHEAADTRVFRPIDREPRNDESTQGDVVWIGNWGDSERTAELHEFLIEPIRRLGLRARMHGVRYPADALETLADADIDFGGWAPNHRVPEIFARYKVTLHIPRRPYVESLPGIPTIRPFEAMACGIPLICSPWDDAEHLFTPGEDYLVARDGDEMTRLLDHLLSHPADADAQAARARETILARHTCRHRVDELIHIAAEIGLDVAPATAAAAATHE